MLDDIQPKAPSNNRAGKKVSRKQFATHTGHALNPRENRFIDEYIKTGDAKNSVINAGYDTKAPHQYAQRILNRDYIMEEINYRMQLAMEEGIADATEIMRYFTSVMRGEIQDQFGLEAPLSERTKCAQELAKRQIDLVNKGTANSEAPKLTITVDWGENASAGVDLVGESVDTASIQKEFDAKPQIKEDEDD